MKSRRLFLMLMCGLLNAGCAFNSVRALPNGDVAANNRALIVYGVTVKGVWQYPKFGLQLAEYDSVKGNISGNCLTFNRTEAVVPSAPGEVQYFAFDVPSGYYVYSPFNVGLYDGDLLAFEAPAGRSVYIGNFTFGKDKQVTLTRDLEGDKKKIYRDLPLLAQDIELSKTISAKRTHIFICTP